MLASWTWAQIVAKIKSVVNRGTLNWSGNNTTYSIPAGYYSDGTLDSRPSYNNGYNAGVTAADNRVNTSSVNYQSGYNAGYSAGAAVVKVASGTINVAKANTIYTVTCGFQPDAVMLYAVSEDTKLGVYANKFKSFNFFGKLGMFGVTSTGFTIQSTGNYMYGYEYYYIAIKF